MMSMLLVMAIFAGYSAYRDEELNIKATIAGMVVLAILVYWIQSNWYFTKRSELVEKFRSGGDVVCVDRNVNAIVSKKSGYVLRGEFFIRNEKAIRVNNCYELY